MKKIHRLTHILLLLALFIGGFVPTVSAQAAQSAQSANPSTTGSSTGILTIENRTTGVISRMEFTGSQSFVLTNIPPGVSKYKIQQGKYKIYYQTVCGQKVKGKVNLTKTQTIVTPFCNKTEITFENSTGAAFVLIMTGNTQYTINVPIGKSKYTIFSGTYRYQATAQCGTKRGKYTFVSVRIRWIWKCK